MRLFAVTLFFLVTLNFYFAFAKQFDQCEFALELFEKHEVPKEDIHKHLCIVSTLLTSRDYSGHLGIYSIGSMWWCANDAPGGSCNVTCASLLDDDIADDVACANLILSQQGLEAFGETMEKCKRVFEAKTNECIAENEVIESLQNFTMLISTTKVPDTTSTASSTTTLQPLTSTEFIKRTTRRSVFRPPTIFTRSTTTTEKTTRRPYVSQTTTAQQESTEDYDEEGSDAIVWVIVVLLIASLIILFVVKHKPFMTNRVSYVRNQGFENSMTNL